jgi:hypothetical protein
MIDTVDESVVNCVSVAVVVVLKQERFVRVMEVRWDQRPQMRNSLATGREAALALELLNTISRFCRGRLGLDWKTHS